MAELIDPKAVHEVAKVIFSALSDGKVTVNYPTDMRMTLQIIAGGIAALSEVVGKEQSPIVVPKLVVR